MHVRLLRVQIFFKIHSMFNVTINMCPKEYHLCYLSTVNYIPLQMDLIGSYLPFITWTAIPSMAKFDMI